MALIKSISGIRGTIGGVPGESLTAIDVVKFTASFGNIIAERREDKSQPAKIVVGRDGRISGEMISHLVINTLVSLGVNQNVLAVDWKGESAPAVATGDGVKEPLNRRATIDIGF